MKSKFKKQMVRIQMVDQGWVAVPNVIKVQKTKRWLKVFVKGSTLRFQLRWVQYWLLAKQDNEMLKQMSAPPAPAPHLH